MGGLPNLLPAGAAAVGTFVYHRMDRLFTELPVLRCGYRCWAYV